MTFSASSKPSVTMYQALSPISPPPELHLQQGQPRRPSDHTLFFSWLGMGRFLMWFCHFYFLSAPPHSSFLHITHSIIQPDFSATRSTNSLNLLSLPSESSGQYLLEQNRFQPSLAAVIPINSLSRTTFSLQELQIYPSPSPGLLSSYQYSLWSQQDMLSHLLIQKRVFHDADLSLLFFCSQMFNFTLHSYTSCSYAVPRQLALQTA